MANVIERLDNMEAEAKPVPENPTGSVVVIGGREDKEDEREILRRVVELARGGPFVVCTAASETPDEVWADYESAFRALGLKDLDHLALSVRADSENPELVRMVERASGLFFSGGDQARITSRLGGTVLCDRIRGLYERGGVVAGTSSGASVMSEVMLTGGEGDMSHRISEGLRMAPGLGLVHGMIIDQHFAERGRIGRLLAAVSQNPRVLGIGIDENTGLILTADEYEVIGAGAVYVVDGRGITYTNVCEQDADRTMSSFNLRLHVLSAGDRFRIRDREPVIGSSTCAGGADENV